MAADVQNFTEDLTGSTWRDDQWLQAYPLNMHTALDYFSLSPFYDMSCNNEKAKAQGLHAAQMLQLFPGTEFVLQEAQEPYLFVIRRQYRSTPSLVAVHAIYYILEGAIYQAPTIYAAVSARLARCQFQIRTAFVRMQADLDPLIAGNEQKEAKSDEVASAAAAAAAKAPSKEENDRNDRVDSIIRSVLRQHGNVPMDLQPISSLPAASTGS